MNLNSKEHKMCLKAIVKNDISIILNHCEKGIGTSSVWDFVQYMCYPKNGYVYFLMKNNIVVYIGASSKNTRIGQHKKDKDFDGFCYFICGNYEHWKLETLLIRKFKTVYNKCKVAKTIYQY